MSGAAPLQSRRPGDADVRDAGPLRTIGDAIRAHARARPDEPAILGSDVPPVSYRMLQGEIDGARRALRGAGFAGGARIAVAIGDSPQAARAVVAVACSAAAIPIDPKLTVAEIERCLAILRPSAVVVIRGRPSAARAVGERRAHPIIEAEFSPGLTLAAPRAGPSAPLDEPDPDAPAFILHTSGTTADPNLVPFSHRNMLAALERLQTWFELTADDRCLNVSPVYYSHALTTTVFPPLMTGGSIAFPSNPINIDLSEWFDHLRPTWYSAGPSMHLAVLEKAE